MTNAETSSAQTPNTPTLLTFRSLTTLKLLFKPNNKRQDYMINTCILVMLIM